MDSLVGALLDGLGNWIKDLPYVIYGHSLGAIIALEFTRALVLRNEPLPRLLLVSARTAPHLAVRRTPVSTLTRDGLKSWLRRINGTPEAVLQSREMMDLFLPVLRADLEIDDNYRSTPTPSLPCPLTVFGGLHDEETTPEELQAWSSYTGSQFTLRMLEGDHFFPFNQGRSAALAALANVLQLVDTAQVIPW
jgi:surfactin synthase thioesterase subunit